jgi:hypothetical protein
MSPLTIEKFSLDSFYLTFPFAEHQKLKNSILTAIDSQKCDSLVATDNYYTDNINKLDWNDNLNYNRDWVKIFKPAVDLLFNIVANAVGYQRCEINELWFQQYIENNTHGWHIHGRNFTGVYYLEFPENAPTTQLINPLDQSKLIIPKVKEGDIIIFPSYTIHRAPVIKHNLRKTIISFNLNFYDIQPEILKQINSF